MLIVGDANFIVMMMLIVMMTMPMTMITMLMIMTIIKKHTINAQEFHDISREKKTYTTLL